MKNQKLIYSLILAGGMILSTAAVSAQETQTKAKTGCEQAAKYTCPMHPEVVQNEPGKCPQCGMDLVKMEHKQMYTCTMHPEILQDQPGKCPKCNMDLIKVEHQEMHQKKDSTVMMHHQMNEPSEMKH